MRIGELAATAGTTAKTLRFYEEQGLLPEANRSPAGYRDYDPGMLPRLDFIHRGQAAGLTLAQIKQVLDIRDTGHAPCIHVRGLLDQRLMDVEQQIRNLTALHAALLELRHHADTPTENCDPDSVCQYL
ncbi:heavy metal-responsive transcriptional regulator [Microbacterium sp. MC2]